jgi:hypothetical protein
VVTGIFQRATTFHDLKRMIVSSILDNDEGFSLRTGKQDLLHWVREYEAHYALMEKAPVMADLEQSDHHRRMAETEFSKLHARVKLLHDHFEQQVILAEKAEKIAKEDKLATEKDYGKRLQDISDEKVIAESRAKQARVLVEQLDNRKREYEQKNADAKGAEVDSLPSLSSELDPLEKQLSDLEKEVKSVSEIFSSMEADAKNLAREEKAKHDVERAGVFETGSKRKDEFNELHQANLTAISNRHKAELEAVSSKVTELRVEESGLEGDVRNAQPDPELQESLVIARQVQTEANASLETLREKTEPLRKAQQKIKEDFEEFEQQINSGEVAIEKSQEELETLLNANNAGEDTFLGFLRSSKPDWSANIGRLVSEETLLRTDLSPVIGEGDSLYGVGVDLDKLKAGRFASEENLQQEIKLVRTRLERRNAEVVEDKKMLAKKKGELDKAKKTIEEHDAAISVAKNSKQAADQKIQDAEKRLLQSKRNAAALAEGKLEGCRNRLKQALENVDATKKDHKDELSQVEVAHKDSIAQVKTGQDAKLVAIETQRKVIEAELTQKLEQIARDRDESLRNNGVSPEVLNVIRVSIKRLKDRIEDANGLRPYVSMYRDWLENTWSQRGAKHKEWQDADADEKRCKRQTESLLKERHLAFEQKQKAIDDAGKMTEKHFSTQRNAQYQMMALSQWPIDNDTLSAGFDPSISIDTLIAERKRLHDTLEEHRENIRLGVEEIRRQMCSVAGTNPDKFHATALQALGNPRQGKEHEWLEVFRNWFNNEHASNRTSLLQLGKTMAQNISSFWKSMGDFKRNVSVFASDLKANLEQGKIFESIADVTTDIRTHVDTQNYWEAVENLHHEYDAWHTQGDSALPPPSFVAAAKEVAAVLSEDKGLVADPVDLISLKISANVNGQGSKTASNEHELANMSSNGLSYIILCVVLIGFVNRIRRKEPVVVPFVVDELKDLSYLNAKTLLELLTRNNITMISAFPDVDLDLAELFARNYKILPGREVGLINLDEEEVESNSEEEIAHV